VTRRMWAARLGASVLSLAALAGCGHRVSPSAAAQDAPGVTDEGAPAACPASATGPAPVTGGAATATGPVRSVTDFGARGDDSADDTAALQGVLDALEPGETLLFPPGTYRHRDVLTVRAPGVQLLGDGATLLATDEERSAFHVAADRVVVSELAFAVESVTRRWDSYEQHKIRVSGQEGVVLHRVQVLNSAASGIFIADGASCFLVDGVTVRDTQADGIHLSGGAHDGTLINPTVIGSGDDGVAVVSYSGEPAPSHDIAVLSPRVRSNTHGRGLSVVGGEDIAFRDVRVESSDAAAVYIAAEGAPYDTYGTRNVTVSGGELIDSNRNPAVDHGAVLVFSGRVGQEVSGVHVEDLTISGTRQDASRQVGLVTAGGDIEGVTLDGLSIRGGPPVAFSSDVDLSSVRIVGWRVDGEPFYVR